MRWLRRAQSCVLLLVALTLGAACAPSPAAPASPLPGGITPNEAAPRPSEAAEGRPRVAVRSAYTSESASELTLQVAHEADTFAKYGLDVTVERIAGGSPKVVAAMLAGDVDIAQIGGPVVADARVAGADLVYTTANIPVLALSLYAIPAVTRMEDLRGNAIAITRAGTVTDFGARTALTHYGLRPEVDVGIVQTGGLVEGLATVQAGNAVATLLGPPYDIIARQQGLHELLDLPSLGVEFLLNGLAVQREYLTRNEDVLMRFMRGYLEAIARIKEDKAFAKQVLGKYTDTTDDAALESGYEAFGQRYLARVPYPTAAQLQTVIDFVAERDPSARDLQPESLFDDRFVRALDQEGFIDRLYR
ncbi:MAG TPA: ABC transporter substrate-binding protein [Chloroflexota bacterium]|nr:ABC transporter substrate-binding protein [Chloroflexota bacterium]